MSGAGYIAPRNVGLEPGDGSESAFPAHSIGANRTRFELATVDTLRPQYYSFLSAAVPFHV